MHAIVEAKPGQREELDQSHMWVTGANIAALPPRACPGKRLEPETRNGYESQAL